MLQCAILDRLNFTKSLFIQLQSFLLFLAVILQSLCCVKPSLSSRRSVNLLNVPDSLDSLSVLASATGSCFSFRQLLQGVMEFGQNKRQQYRYEFYLVALTCRPVFLFQLIGLILCHQLVQSLYMCTFSAIQSMHVTNHSPIFLHPLRKYLLWEVLLNLHQCFVAVLEPC